MGLNGLKMRFFVLGCPQCIGGADCNLFAELEKYFKKRWK